MAPYASRCVMRQAHLGSKPCHRKQGVAGWQCTLCEKVTVMQASQQRAPPPQAGRGKLAEHPTRV